MGWQEKAGAREAYLAVVRAALARRGAKGP
jgi:hypothetical protein